MECIIVFTNVKIDSQELTQMDWTEAIPLIHFSKKMTHTPILPFTRSVHSYRLMWVDLCQLYFTFIHLFILGILAVYGLKLSERTNEQFSNFFKYQCDAMLTVDCLVKPPIDWIPRRSQTSTRIHSGLSTLEACL